MVQWTSKKCTKSVMHVRAVVLIIKPIIIIFLSCRGRRRSSLSSLFPFRRAGPHRICYNLVSYKGSEKPMVNRVLIQTEIDYKIKKRIIHLDENYFWNHEKKKKQKSISKYKY